MATAIQFLRSSLPGLRPEADSLLDGMPMVNTYKGEPGLFFKLSDNSIAKIGPAHVGTEAPNASPQLTGGNSAGEMWLDTTLSTAILKVWSGDKWVPSGTDLSGADRHQVIFSNNERVVGGSDELTYNSLTRVLEVSNNAVFGTSSINRFEVNAEARFTSRVKVGGTRLNPNIDINDNGNITLGGTLAASSNVKVGQNDEVTINGSTGDITTADGVVTAHSFVGDGSRIYNLNIPGSMTFQGSIDATATGPGAPAAVTGDFYMNTVDGTVTSSFTGAAGSVIEAGQFIYYTVDGDWVVSSTGTLYVSIDADQTVRGKKTWNDEQTFKSDVTAQSNLTVGGDVSLGTPLTTTDTMTVHSPSTFMNDLLVKGDIQINGTMTVEDQSVLKENTIVADGKLTTLGGELTVKDAAKMKQTLDVAGDATFAKIQATNYFIDSLPALPA
jgi:hypothetical protein